MEIRTAHASLAASRSFRANSSDKAPNDSCLAGRILRGFARQLSVNASLFTSNQTSALIPRTSPMTRLSAMLVRSRALAGAIADDGTGAHRPPYQSTNQLASMLRASNCGRRMA